MSINKTRFTTRIWGLSCVVASTPFCDFFCVNRKHAVSPRRNASFWKRPLAFRWTFLWTQSCFTTVIWRTSCVVASAPCWSFFFVTRKLAVSPRRDDCFWKCPLTFWFLFLWSDTCFTNTIWRLSCVVASTPFCELLVATLTSDVSPRRNGCFETVLSRFGA